MSELPWENKKVAEVMSSVEDEHSPANASGEKKGSTPPIPDILANAFADIPMEEAKIEIPEDAPVGDNSEPSQPSFPSFGDLPDLSALGGTPPRESPEEKKEIPMEMPPFMMPSSDEGGSGVVESPSPFMQSNDAGVIPPQDQPPVQSPSNMETPAKKRSPPPLFEPFINSDEAPDIPSPEGLEPPMPFASEPSQFPPIAEQSETPLTPGALPFSVPNESEVSNTFESSPDAVPKIDPFTAPAGDITPSDPFASTVSSVESNPFEPPSEVIPPIDPFASTVDSVDSDPFEPPSEAIPPTDPFASTVDSNPFAASPGAGQSGNPFGDPVPQETGSFEKNKPAQKLQGKLPIDVGSFKKNLEGISGITKGFFKNLAKGKSLIERMEDMREEVDVAGSVKENAVSGSKTTSNASPFDSSPFESQENKGDSNPFSPPFDENSQAIEENTGESVNPFMEYEDDGSAGDIRQVTPIENPIMEMKEEYLLDNDDFGGENANAAAFPDIEELTSAISVPSADVEDSDSVVNDVVTDIVAMTPSSDIMPGSDKLFIPGQVQDSLSDINGHEVEDVITHDLSAVESMDLKEKTSSTSGMELSKKVISKEIKDIKFTTDKKFENMEDDLGGLKDSLKDMNLQFSSMHSEVEEFSNRLSEITESVASAVSSSENVLSQTNSRFDLVDGKVSQVEMKVSEFDSSLGIIQSDNVSIKANLSQLEGSISELVNSYTALLAQLHESLQENEAKFAILADLSSKIDAFTPRVELIEKMQEESKATSKEFSRSMSSMLDNLGKVSSDFQEFRQESEEKNTAVLEKIDSLTEYMESELKKLGARSYKGFGQNVHLSNIVKNSSNMKLCMEWLEFLMELVGRNNLPDILSYYEELGWLTEKVRMELLNYAEGIDFYMEKPDWKLTPDDHVKSIWFIESLAGMKVDKNRLSVIERDIEKVKKGSEIYGI
ncbi:putative archaeal flagellar protein D/E [Methanolobus tindarius DSM 2278]|uniref:Putative archaeal flagellar protein D/E n=1 Tax=Methanolobus tindarius DSM 2278 TaxID=1090322 RepID=W9DVH4_METTI|nr:FlaD/FlaE family flagellar protein [Methanolobus tindarius]ETA67426.1 putative archaeal flagellar protein D/E [Methanolobus tindarius DSM 2278]